MSLPRSSKLSAYQSVAVRGGITDADPHALVLMLMNAALERMQLAQGCIARGEIARKAQLLHNCVRIIAELRGSLDLGRGGELAQNLSDLYEYMAHRLLRANVENDSSYVTEVVSLLNEIRGAWAAIGPEVRKAAGADAGAQWTPPAVAP